MSVHDINELLISKETWRDVTFAIENIAASAGDNIAVCVVLIDIDNPKRIYARTDGPPEILREAMGLPPLDDSTDTGAG